MASKTAEPPKRLRKDHRRCTQTQCGYFLQGGCKACSKCKARPFEINTKCKTCLDCENVPNALRWTEPKKEKNAIATKEQQRAMLQSMKIMAEIGLEELDKKEIEPPVEEPEIIIEKSMGVN